MVIIVLVVLLVKYESTLLISGDGYGWIYIWNQTTSELLQKIKAHSDEVTSMIVLNNGNLATASSDTTIKIRQKINETSFQSIINYVHITIDIVCYSIPSDNVILSKTCLIDLTYLFC